MENSQQEEGGEVAFWMVDHDAEKKRYLKRKEKKEQKALREGQPNVSEGESDEEDLGFGEAQNSQVEQNETSDEVSTEQEGEPPESNDHESSMKKESPKQSSAAAPLNTPSNNAAEQCDDDNEYDEEEDVWDELRILTVRNTFVNKHMSYIDLRSKQLELVNADASNWEDIFIEDEDSEEETKRSTFSRWEIKDEILLSMMLAVRTSANSTYQQLRRSKHDTEVSVSDFKSCRRYNISVGGIGQKIVVKDYAPLVFHRLRQSFSISPHQYLRAWGHNRIAKEDNEDILAYSSDNRFILLKISSEQAKILINILPSYYLYLKANLVSMIVRYFGFHQIATKGKKLYFVVAGNVFGNLHPRTLKEFFFVREPQYEEKLNSRAKRFRSRAVSLPEMRQYYPEQPTNDSNSNTSPSPLHSPLTTSNPSLSSLPSTAPSSPISSSPPPSSLSSSPSSTTKRNRLGGLKRRLSRNMAPSADTGPSNGVPSNKVLPRGLGLSVRQKDFFLTRLEEDCKFLAQTGLANYALLVGIPTPDIDDVHAQEDTSTRTKNIGGVVHFIELSKNEVKKVVPVTFQPHLRSSSKPSSPPVLKKKSQQSEENSQLAKAADQNERNRAKTAPTNLGSPGSSRKDNNKLKENLLSVSGQETTTRAYDTMKRVLADEDWAFYKHLSDGAVHVISQQPAMEKKEPNGDEESGAEDESKEERMKRERQLEKDRQWEQDKEKDKQVFHFGLIDILHKPTRPAIRIMGSSSHLTAPQYAQSIREAITEKLLHN